MPRHQSMNSHINRRQFINQATAAGVATIVSALPLPAASFRGRIRKAMIIGEVTEKALEPLKTAGFQGVETTHICPEAEAAKGRAVAEQLGMRVHSVLRGWMEFNSDDPKKVDDSLENTRKALRAAKAYDADDILLRLGDDLSHASQLDGDRGCISRAVAVPAPLRLARVHGKRGQRSLVVTANVEDDQPAIDEGREGVGGVHWRRV